MLEAERDAETAVAACERSGSEVLEAARRRARAILERAQARAVKLHVQGAKKLEVCAAQLMEQRLRSAADIVKQLSNPDRLAMALDRLAAQLTTDTAAPDVF